MQSLRIVSLPLGGGRIPSIPSYTILLSAQLIGNAGQIISG
jgi:hypothetical protein